MQEARGSSSFAIERTGRLPARSKLSPNLHMHDWSKCPNVRRAKCDGRSAAKIVSMFLIASVSISNCHAQSASDAGSSALKKADYKGAETIYRRLVTEFPDSPEAQSDLGIALQMQGKSSEAIRAFKHALKQKSMPRIYALLAAEECKTRDLGGARPMVKKISHDYANDPTVMAIVAPCYLELDDPIGAVEAYRHLLSYPDYPPDQALIQLARSYQYAGQFFFGLLSKAPDKLPYISAIRDASEKRAPDARGAFELAARASSDFQLDLDFSGAVAKWHEHPHDSALLYLLTVLSGEQSMQQVETCAQMYPASPHLAQLKAEMVADQGHEEEAAAQYASLIKSHPELPDLLFDLGMLFRKEREWDEALAVFRQQLEKDPGDERTAARVSEAMIQLGRWEELNAFLKTIVAMADPPLWAMLDFADASEIRNKPQQAITTLVSAEQHYPTDKVVHYRLSRLYRLTGKAAQSATELKLFRELSN